MNASRIYNVSLANVNAHILNNRQAYLDQIHSVHQCMEQPWAHSLELDGEFFLNGFLLYSLLLAKSEHGTTLFLEHDKQSQRLRLQDALMERNKQMEGPGQEAYLHACDLCFFVFEDDHGNYCAFLFIILFYWLLINYTFLALDKVQAVVCDGNSIGFPCCAVHDCNEPLITLRDRFCHSHDHLKAKCAVTTCTESHETGFRTCSEPAHRALELAYFSKGKSLLQLKARLNKAHNHSSASPSTPLDSLEELEDSDEAMIEGTFAECEGKSETGNRKLKAYFGRRRTHNEQLIVRTCGVILSRATMYGSEAVSGVNVGLPASSFFCTYPGLIFRNSPRQPFLLQNQLPSSLYLTITADWIYTSELSVILTSMTRENQWTSFTSRPSTR
jgi:hypothetical protein